MRGLAHRWRDRFPPKGIRLPRDRVRQIVEAHGAQSWFLYAFEERHTRWDLWESGFWVLRHLPRWSRILETGCGCGLNLIWLGQQHFTDLHGFDLDPKAIAAGEELCREAGVPARRRSRRERSSAARPGSRRGCGATTDWIRSTSARNPSTW
jgi:hypothetical protein